MIEHIKELGAIFVGLISLIASIINPFLIDDGFLVRDNDHPTYGEVIQKIKDDNLGVEGCKKIRVQFSINYSEESARSYCITEIAKYERKPELCKTEGQKSYNFCVEQVAYETKEKTTINPQLDSDEVFIKKGEYQFGESIGSGSSEQSWNYKLNIKNNGGIGEITLNVDGFQTKTRIRAKGVVSQKSIDAVFDSYGPDNMFTPYTKGDVLFTLTPTKDGLALKWKKMQSMLPLNQTGGYLINLSDLK